MLPEIPLQFATRLINSGPLLLVGTQGDRGPNMAPVAWHMPGAKTPPLLHLTIGVRHQTWANIEARESFSCNLVPPALLKAVGFFGGTSGHSVEKFARAPVAWHPSSLFGMPFLDLSPGMLECALLNLDPERHLVTAEIKRAHADPALFQERWCIEKEVPIVHHLGGEFFQCGGELLRQERISDW